MCVWVCVCACVCECMICKYIFLTVCYIVLILNSKKMLVKDIYFSLNMYCYNIFNSKCEKGIFISCYVAVGNNVAFVFGLT